MRNYNTNGLIALAVVGGSYFFWRNRFAIQRGLESIGIKTPLLRGSMGETARSIASKVRGKMERGATLAEREMSKVG